MCNDAVVSFWPPIYQYVLSKSHTIYLSDTILRANSTAMCHVQKFKCSFKNGANPPASKKPILRTSFNRLKF